MEGILEVFTRPYDATRQFSVWTRPTGNSSARSAGSPRHSRPASPSPGGTNYVRNGIAQIFIEVGPLAGRLHVELSLRRTRRGWARWIRGKLTDRCPRAAQVVLVLDNLNSHTMASLYEAYPPTRPLTFAERLEIHYPPKHGSWLNIAEIELGVLCVQCLNRRIPDHDAMREEIDAWLHDRNTRQSKVDWQFTTAATRLNLKHLYPNSSRCYVLGCRFLREIGRRL